MATKSLIVIAGGGIAQIENAVGCLMAMERCGFDLHSPEYDWRGTSAGAIVASMIASGSWTAHRLAQYLNSISTVDLIYRRWWWPVRWLAGGAMYNCDGARALIRQAIGERIVRNVIVVTTRARGMIRVEMPAHLDSVIASFAIDSIFPPVPFGPEVFLDGGYSDNVPLEPWRIPMYRHVYLILPPADPDDSRHAKTAIGRRLQGFSAKIGQETTEADRIYDRQHYANLTKFRPSPINTSLLALSSYRELIGHAENHAMEVLTQ